LSEKWALNTEWMWNENEKEGKENRKGKKVSNQR
jgi:hypothetical protein